jgi:hypothetical protein
MNSPVKMEDASLKPGSVTPKMTVEMDQMRVTLVMKRLVLTINSLVLEVVTVYLNRGSVMETTTVSIKQMNKIALQSSVHPINSNVKTRNNVFTKVITAMGFLIVMIHLTRKDVHLFHLISATTRNNSSARLQKSVSPKRGFVMGMQTVKIVVTNLQAVDKLNVLSITSSATIQSASSSHGSVMDKMIVEMDQTKTVDMLVVLLLLLVLQINGNVQTSQEDAFPSNQSAISNLIALMAQMKDLLVVLMHVQKPDALTNAEKRLSVLFVRVRRESN